MTRRLFGALAVAVLTAAITATTQSSAGATSVCGNAGAYTDTLCAGGRLELHQYLISPNGRYRFYYQGDGHTLIYDTIDWNNWDPSVPIFEPHENASYLMYGVDWSRGASTQVTMWSFDSANASALPYYIYWGEAQSAGHYLKLEDDGCLRSYEADGSFMLNVWC